MEPGQYVFNRAHTAELDGVTVMFRSRWSPWDPWGASRLNQEAANALEESGAFVGYYGDSLIRVDGRHLLGEPDELTRIARDNELYAFEHAA